MRSMVLDAPRRPLRPAELPVPRPGPGQLRLRVRACGVCRTDLHVVDGELTRPKLPLVLGHQIVGIVEESGSGAGRHAAGSRVGVPWLGWTCGECAYCLSGRENLCRRARFTGYDLDGGYAEMAVADERFCFPIPEGYPDTQAAPLLCPGLIGWRSLKLAGDGERLGLYGFGAAAHLVAQVARHQGRRAAVGGARPALGREPHARGRRGVPRSRPAGAGADAGDFLRARGRGPGAGRFAVGTRAGVGGDRDSLAPLTPAPLPLAGDRGWRRRLPRHGLAGEHRVPRGRVIDERGHDDRGLHHVLALDPVVQVHVRVVAARLVVGLVLDELEAGQAHRVEGEMVG